MSDKGGNNKRHIEERVVSFWILPIDTEVWAITPEIQPLGCMCTHCHSDITNRHQKDAVYHGKIIGYKRIVTGKSEQDSELVYDVASMNECLLRGRDIPRNDVFTIEAFAEEEVERRNQALADEMRAMGRKFYD